MSETSKSLVVIVNFHGSVIFALLHQGKKMYEHNASGYWSGLALCLTKVRSSRARCPATALIYKVVSSQKLFDPSHEKIKSGFPTGFDINWPVQSQKKARSLKIWN